jgi:hypothetical protein
MPKATDKNITTRRTFLSMVSAGIAAGATFIAAAPALALPADPIFAAIAVHLLTAEGDGPLSQICRDESSRAFEPRPGPRWP